MKKKKNLDWFPVLAARVCALAALGVGGAFVAMYLANSLPTHTALAGTNKCPAGPFWTLDPGISVSGSFSSNTLTFSGTAQGGEQSCNCGDFSYGTPVTIGSDQYTITNSSGTVVARSALPNWSLAQGPASSLCTSVSPANEDSYSFGPGTVNTSGWAPGVYTLTVTIGDSCGGPFTNSGYTCPPPPTDTYVFTVTGGTISVLSQNAAGNPLSSSWGFVGPLGGPCEGTPLCSGTSGIYNNQPPGTYSLSPGSAPSGYSGYTIYLNNNYNQACSVTSCAGTLQNGGTLTFTIKWNLIEPAIAASWNTTYLVQSIATTVPAGSNLNISDYIRNIGPTNSSLDWICSVHGPAGWTGTLNYGLCQQGRPLSGGASPFQ